MDCGLPMKLQDVGIDESKLKQMAEDAVWHNDFSTSFVPMNAQDIAKILKDSL